MNTFLKLCVVAVLVLAAVWGISQFWSGDEPVGPRTVTENQPEGEGEETPTPTVGEGPTGPGEIGTAGDPGRVEVSTTVSGEEFAQGVHGIVVDPAGNPVVDAEVYLMESPNRDLFRAMVLAQQGVVQPPVAMTRSAEDGTFSLGLRKPLAEKTYEIRAIHDRFANARIPNLNLSKNTWYDAGPVRMPAGLVVHGRVTVAGSGGLPVSGARVYIRPIESLSALNPTPGRERGIVAITDSSGHYRVENAQHGLVNLTALAPGYARGEKVTQPVKPNQNNEFNFELPQGKSIAGVATDASGKPLARAKITASAISAKQPLAEEAMTDRDGRFEILGLIDGPYKLVGFAQGHVQAELAPVQAGETDAHIVFDAQCTAVLRVTTKSGRVVKSYEVAVKRYFEGQEHLGNAHNVPPQLVTSRDLTQNDEFEMTGLDPGGYVFEVQAKGFAKTYSEPFLAEIGATPPRVDLVVAEGGRLSGLVVSEDGTPLSNVEVTTLPNHMEENPLTEVFFSMMPSRITRTSTKTDRNGRYSLDTLAIGTYQLKFKHSEHYDVSLKGVQVADEQLTEVESQTMRRGTVISGVVDVDGRVSPHVKVNVSSVPDPDAPQQRPFSGEATTDAKGRFVLDKRLPPGRYTAQAARQTLGSPMMQVLDFAKTQREFTLAPGQETFTLNFSIQSTTGPNRIGR